jgi:phosphoribosylformimino-5-aminoimidazole carboxamide ribonucleotide (ProFAR) isomerase
MLETVIAVISGLTALGSLWFTERQWRKINKKIAMITDATAAFEVLPAWYTKRMMSDEWYFGLRTVDGHVIAISKITAISDDGKWMDVNLLTIDEIPDCDKTNFITAVANDRRSASIQIEKIVFAYDIITS